MGKAKKNNASKAIERPTEEATEVAQAAPLVDANGQPILDDATDRAMYMADKLGINLPPVVPAGFKLEPVPEAPKPLKFYQALYNRPENAASLHMLFIVTTMMVTIPLALMAFGYYYLLTDADEETRINWSAGMGAAGVNLVLVGFSIYAYYDNYDEEDAEPEHEEIPSYSADMDDKPSNASKSKTELATLRKRK